MKRIVGVITLALALVVGHALPASATTESQLRDLIHLVAFAQDPASKLSTLSVEYRDAVLGRANELIGEVGTSGDPAQAYAALSTDEQALLRAAVLPGPSASISGSCNVEVDDCASNAPGAPAVQKSSPTAAQPSQASSAESVSCVYYDIPDLVQRTRLGTVAFVYGADYELCYEISATPVWSGSYGVYSPSTQNIFWNIGTEYGHVDTGNGTPTFHSQDNQIFEYQIAFKIFSTGIDCSASWRYDHTLGQGPASGHLDWLGHVDC